MKSQNPEFRPGPGFQPVRGLHSRIIGLFENAAPQFFDTIKEQVAYAGANPKISYWMDDRPVQSPKVEGLDGKISIQETFLSYLWAISYAIPVSYDERVNKPRNEPGYAGSVEHKKIVSESENLFRYALSLRERYTEWDIENLPNPQLITPDSLEAEYIDKISAAFLQSVVFILIHEFAHFYLGHLENDNLANKGELVISKSELISDELAADKYAIDVLLEGANHIVPLPTIRVGIVLGLCAVLFLNSSVDGDTHPDPHHRLREALTLMNPEPNDPVWALASMGLAMWAWHYKKPWVGGNTYETLQENFLLMVNQLDRPEYR